MNIEVEIIKAEIDQFKTWMISTMTVTIVAIVGYWSVSNLKGKIALAVISGTFLFAYLILGCLYEKSHKKLIDELKRQKKKR